MNVTQSPAGQRDIYGAVLWAISQFQGGKGRNIAVIFTDGRDGRLSPRWLRNQGNARRAGLSMATNSVGEEVMDPLFGLHDDAEAREFDALLNTMAGSGTTFYFVAVNTSRDPEFGPAIIGRRISGVYPGAGEVIGHYISETHSRMERIAGATGGRVIYGDNPDEAIATYEHLDRILGFGLYRLEFAAEQPPDGAHHEIDVRMNNPTLRATQYLSGYSSR
jgi:hypothetical protein